MPRKYNEYLSVDSDFIPVFSAHSDRDFPNKWKSFYPHESFKTIIKQLLDTLEMSSTEKNKPIWMSGAYGTGKTYASFVIKHLLEDDLDSVKSYCESNNMMDIFARISGIRNKGKTLVVHRSSSASIVGNNRLFNCLVESVKNALKANGCNYFGQKSQFDKVISILKDPLSSFDFSKAFQKHRAKFDGYAKPESVIHDLEDLGADDTLELLETIIDVAEQEGYVWVTSTEEIIDWIDDVVKNNHLYAVVFIWDEFTEFFKNNQNNITGLQKIAEAAASLKFYLFLITHGNAQIINDKSARQVIEARFKLPSIEMADATAFILMSKAIKKNNDLKSEWDNTVSDLWRRVETSTKNQIIRISPDIRETELKDLFPIHPYAAYLLKFIAKDISSNQRTMFQFLSGDYSDGENSKTNFRWFIDNFGNKQGEWNFLTADYVWTYFFTSDNVDLDSTFKTVISHYNNYESICGNDENKKRVLRVALLLTGMQQKSGATRASGQSGLLRPTLGNISATFVGTPIENQVSNIMAEFTQKGVFSKIEENNDTLFIPPVGNMDEDKFNEVLEDTKKLITFEKLIADSNYNVYDAFLPNDYLQYRYEIMPVTPNNYKEFTEKANNLKPSKIAMFFVFAKNEIDQTKVKDTIQKIFDNCNNRILVIDFSGQVFTDANIDKFVKSKAEEKYFSSSPNQASHQNLAKQNAKKLVDEWKNKLYVTSLDVFTTVNDSSKCQGGGNLRKKIKETNAEYFGCGLEEVSVNDKLFAQSGYKETVAQMGMSKFAIPNNFSYLNMISIKLTNDGIWNDANYVSTRSSHPVARIKAKINEIINEGFSKNSKVAVTDIWEALEKPPFGLMTCTGSVFLLGFLLREYADSTYYKYDGANTVCLNYTDLSDLIVGVVKELPKVRNQFIVKQTPEHTEFCRITGDIFRIPKNKQNSIDDIAKNINVFLKNNEYPLWCLKPYIENEWEENPIQNEALQAVSLFCEFIATEKKAGRDSTKVAEDLYRLYKTTSMLDKELEKVVVVENMQKGMDYYIATYNPELIKVTKRLGVLSNVYLYALNKKLSADASYLWDKGDIERQIDNLYEDYHFIDCINAILSEKKVNYGDSRKAVADKLNIIKVPFNLIMEERPDLRNVFQALFAIKKNEIFNKADAIKTLEEDAAEFNIFFNNQTDMFAKILRKHINVDVTDDEVDELFGIVPSDTISKSTDEFKINMTRELFKYRKNKKVNQLKELWKSKTNTANAIELSAKLEFPILIAFPSENTAAEEVFGIVNGTRLAMDETIDRCLDFVKSNSFNILFNEEVRNSMFLEYFCGEYAYLVKDINDFKTALSQIINVNIYHWYAQAKFIRDFAKKYAEEIYKKTTIKQVREKIKDMKQESIAQCLMTLVEDKPLVGIAILKDKE